LSNWRAFRVIEISFNRAIRERCGAGHHTLCARGTVDARHRFALNGALNNATATIRLNLGKRRQFANTIRFHVTRLRNSIGLHIARFANWLSHGKRFGVHQIAIRVGAEAWLIRVQGLGDPNRPTL